MVMIELSDTEKLSSRAMLPPNFSAAFASPSLRWACKKRLRCLHPDTAGHDCSDGSVKRIANASDDDHDRDFKAEQCAGARDSGSCRLLRSGFRSEVEEPDKKRKKKVCRVELWVSLSRDEIEEDFVWMTGAKPPRKSRRREKVSFDHPLTTVFPGAWMPSKISAARYRVPEPSDSRKTQITVLGNGI